MKIGEIIELTKTERLSKIAKERLSISEKPTRDALKLAGCYAISGKKGWFFDGDKSVLEQPIYDFVPAKKVTHKPKATNHNASISASEEIASTIETPVKESNIKASRKKVASELDSIDVLLLQNQEESENRTYRGFYWDKDIISFLDGIKHGNKSDLMNEIVRTVLKDKGLLK